MTSSLQFPILSSNFSLKHLGTSFSAKQWLKRSLWYSHLMDLSFRRLSLIAIISFHVSVSDVNLEKDVSVNSFPPVETRNVDSTLKPRGNGRFFVVSTWNPRGVFVGSELVCLTNMVGATILTNLITRFLLPKRWFFSSLSFPFRLKMVADWFRLLFSDFI